MNSKNDHFNNGNKRAKVEPPVKAKKEVKPQQMAAKAGAFDFGDPTRSENPLRKLVVPTALLWEYEKFEKHILEEMESINSPHSADYDRCMFCWLRHTMTAPDPSERNLMGRFLLFSRAWHEMYYSTLEGSKCIECNGSLPLGKDETTGEDRSEF